MFGVRLERGGRLLFPGAGGGMLGETRRLLDRVAKRAHTFAATRL